MINLNAIRNMAIALLAIGVVLVSEGALAQAPDVIPSSPKTEDTVVLPKNEIAIEPKADDQKIAQRLNEILLATDWFVGSTVRVREGVVFLDGEAREETSQEVGWRSGSQHSRCGRCCQPD